MPGALLRRLGRGLVLGAALLLPAAPAWAAGGTAQVSMEIDAGKTKTVRLRNLPSGTKVAVAVVSTHRLALALVSRAEAKSPSPEALFKGALDRRMTFSVTIPESDHYYLVLDNRRGAQTVKARVTIRAEHEPDRPSSPAPAPPGGKAL